MQNKRIGEQTLSFQNPIAITSFASIVGPKEGKGPLGNGFDYVLPDNLYGQKSWEKTEQKMAEHSLNIA